MLDIFKLVKWSDLQLADILYLKRGDVSPADILVIESSDSTLAVSELHVFGNRNLIPKEACKLTSEALKKDIQKTNGINIRHLLNGRIEYSRQRGEITGFIKLKYDPQGEDISNKNIIFRGSTIMNTDFIYGVILFAGE